jgi:hypothetical protein
MESKLFGGNGSGATYTKKPQSTLEKTARFAQISATAIVLDRWYEIGTRNCVI